MVHLQTVRIADLGRVLTGKTPPSSRPELFGDTYPFLTPTDIDGYARYIEPERFLSTEGCAFQHRLLLPERSVSVVCIGATIGKVCMTRRPSFTNQQINSVVVNENEHDPFFVYHLMTTLRDELKANAGGAATPIINKTAFSEIEVSVPPLPVQRRIASILSAYDELIENCQRRIKILEQMARGLYLEWFVNFRYPHPAKTPLMDSPLGKIPKGWEVKNLGDVVALITKGTTPTTLGKKFVSKGVNFFKAEAIEDSGALIEAKFAKIDLETHELLKRSQLCTNDILFSIAGVIGRVCIVPSRTLPANTNQALAIIRCSSNFVVPFLYMTLRDERFKNYSFGRIVQTAQANVSLSELKSAPVILPHHEILSRFNALAEPWMAQIQSLSERIQNLRKTRDLLLPRLMSGQISIN